MSEREFPVRFDPKQGAIVEMPTECPICHCSCDGSYDIHMALAHPLSRPFLAFTAENTKKPKRRR